MYLKNINDYSNKTKNIGMITRHLKEISDLPNTNYEEDYKKLRNVHELESNLYFFYENLHKKKRNEEFHGYIPIKEVELVFKAKSLKGTIFALSSESVFENLSDKMTITNSEELTFFNSALQKTPFPFIFLGDGELLEFHEFMKEIYGAVNEYQKKVYVGENFGCSFMIMEPFTLNYLDLDYLIDDLIADPSICNLLAGFIIPK